MIEKRDFWLYTTGMFVSFLGSGVQDIALPLFILDLTGSGTAMGTFMIVTMAPRLILSPLAGVIGDKINRKWIMVWMDFGRGCVVLVLAFLATMSVLTIPTLFIAQFLISIMNALFVPATLAMLPDIVEEEDLIRANSIVDATANFSDLAGPLLGGIIYGLGGIQAAFLINGISFLGSGSFELFIRYHQETKKFREVSEIVDDLREGINFIRNHRGLLILLLFALATNVLSGPLTLVLIPYVLRIVIKFSAEQYGLLQTTVVVGALIGNIIIATVLARSKIEELLKTGFLARIGIMLIFAVLIFPRFIEAFDHTSWTFFCILSVIFILRGIVNAFVSTPVMVGFQKLLPTKFRARVFSVMNTITMGMVPVGYGVMGILLDLFPAHMVAITVVLIELCVVLIFILKSLKEVSREFERAYET